MKIGTASDLHLLISSLLVLYPLYIASANWSQVDSEGRGKTIQCRNMCLPMKGRNNNPKTQKQQAPQGKENSINSIKVREESQTKKKKKKKTGQENCIFESFCQSLHMHILTLTPSHPQACTTVGDFWEGLSKGSIQRQLGAAGRGHNRFEAHMAPSVRPALRRCPTWNKARRVSCQSMRENDCQRSPGCHLGSVRWK